MSLFQTSVLKKYLKLQDAKTIKQAYKKYAAYFLDAAIQENIKNSKEEEYQGIFLTELFDVVLGYTLKPKKDFNLVAEYKNENNSRKADGAILKNNNAIAVIELKGTKTKDLESIRKQAFDYKANQKGCVYVITSNFEKLRFYINDATEFIEFNLFTLDQNQFKLLYLCLSKESIFKDLPLKIKNDSVTQEEEITKNFYKDYSLFKRELYRDLVANNAKKLKNARKNEISSTISDQETEQALIRLEKNVKLTLFKKSQKLIDRFLFIFFAEDRGLLPPNSTVKILQDWDKLKELDAIVPLYDRFKLYFKHLDTGRKGTDKNAEIFAYNGGLFKTDYILNSIYISDDLLYKHTQKLANYDFESQVDVNILGHIFENSLNEIESINAEIEGADFDKQTSKRKKDGVFYTPKYITKYIVENTVGKLCTEKRQALKFKEEEYFKSRKNRPKAKIKELVQILDTYRDWLLTLTICDPACGSGAFLNQALDFLIKEHQYIDELKANVLGGGFVFADIETTILENNIYGVDLNEESVEIAKLSLWLRTAQPRRKLNNLNSNIKCGNSLIDSKAVAGDKAFNWQEQFPNVFEKGGFDVVIGNPPYVQLQKIKLISRSLKEMRYNSYDSSGDLYCLFYEKGINILKINGCLGYITSNKWLKANYGKNLRNFILLNTFPYSLIDLGAGVFDSASVDSNILLLEKNKKEKVLIPSLNINKSFNSEIAKNNFNNIYFDFDEMWVISSEVEMNIKKKIEINGVPIKSLGVKIFRGLLTGYNEAFLIDKSTMKKLVDEDANCKNIIKPVLRGRDITRFGFNDNETYIINTHNGYENNERINIDDYPSIKNHLNKFKDKLLKRYDQGNTFYNLRNCAYLDEFKKDKIVWASVGLNEYSYVAKDYILLDTNYFVVGLNKYHLAILNSKLIIKWFVEKTDTLVGKTAYRHYKYNFEKIPIPIIDSQKQIVFIEKSDLAIKLKSNFLKLNSKLFNYFINKYFIIKLSKKLQNWHLLEFGEFIKEINKAIKANNKLRVKEGLQEIPILTKKEEFEWLELFEENKQKATALQTQINQTDKEIDQMVYKLYGLTQEEIEIVENS